MLSLIAYSIAFRLQPIEGYRPVKSLIYGFHVQGSMRLLSRDYLREKIRLKRAHAQALRRVSTFGIVLGFSLTLSALILPQFPARFFDFLFGDYTNFMDALVVDERVFSLIAGFTVLVTSSIIHFLMDVYLEVFEDINLYSEGDRLRMAVLVSFFLAFVLARVAVILSGIVGPETAGSAGWLPVSEVWFSGYHIHHFFFGFLALTVSGWLLLFHTKVPRLYPGILYGTGLGILIDEVGLLLTEGDYFASSSYFVAMTFLSLMLVGIYWDKITWKTLKR